jgi:hypothetical protein
MFSPIFATLPPLEGFKVITSKNEPVTISLKKGVPSSSSTYKDAYTFMLLERPSHGMISDLDPATNNVVYSPHAGYHGSDFFTFRVQTGGVSSWPATVSITVEADGDDVEMGDVQPDAAKSRRQPVKNNFKNDKPSK